MTGMCLMLRLTADISGFAALRESIRPEQFRHTHEQAAGAEHDQGGTAQRQERHQPQHAAIGQFQEPVQQPGKTEQVLHHASMNRGAG